MSESSTRKESVTYHVSDAARWSLAKASALIEPAKLAMKHKFKTDDSMLSGKENATWSPRALTSVVACVKDPEYPISLASTPF